MTNATRRQTVPCGATRLPSAGVLLTLLVLLASVDAAPGLVAGGTTSPGPIPGCPDLVWGSLPIGGSAEFPDRQSLCSSIPGEPLPADLLPPEDLVSLEEQNAYAERVLSDFLQPRRYDTELGWAGDARWRLSGDIEGCPSQSSFASFGVHRSSGTRRKWSVAVRRPQHEIPVGATVVRRNTFRAASSPSIRRRTAPGRTSRRTSSPS
jgi:hypothetical protein